MKTKEQVLNQLKHYIFNKEDWKNVKSYCNFCFGKGFYKSFRGKISCNYDDFVEWMQNGYAIGDIVRYGRTIGIVAIHHNDFIRLSAYINPLGELVREVPDDIDFSIDNVQPADEADIETMISILSSNGLEIAPLIGKLSKRHRKTVGKMYRFFYNGTKNVGILESIDEKNAVFCYAYDGESLNKEKIAVSILDILDPVPMEETNRIKVQMLSKYGVAWSLLNKKFLYYGIRGVYNTPYFYITDKFTITSCSDLHTGLHDMRYKMGNYFRTFEEASQFLKAIQGLRGEMKKRDDHH